MQWAAVSIKFSFRIVPPQNSSPSSFNRTACEAKKGKCRRKKCSLMLMSCKELTDFSGHYRDAAYCTMYMALQVSPRIAFPDAEATDWLLLLQTISTVFMWRYHLASTLPHSQCWVMSLRHWLTEQAGCRLCITPHPLDLPPKEWPKYGNPFWLAQTQE